MMKKVHAADHPSVADALNNMAVVMDKQGLLGQAISLHDEALRVRKKAHGEDHPDVADTLNRKC